MDSCSGCIQSPRRKKTKVEGVREIEYLRLNAVQCEKCEEQEKSSSEIQTFYVSSHPMRRRRKRPKSKESVTAIHLNIFCSHKKKGKRWKRRYERIEKDFENYYLAGKCTKNPGHTKFIPVNRFTVHTLPEHIQDADVCECIKQMIPLTVKLRVKVQSSEKTEVKFGSGSLYISQNNYSHAKCPCDICIKSHSEPVTAFRFIRVTTALHVIADDAEAKMTEVIINFDDENSRENVITLRGHRLVNTDKKADRCILECVTHDLNLYQKILDQRSIVRELEQGLKARFGQNCPNLAVVISHPHGMSKMVSFGKVTEKFINFEDDVEPDRQKTSFRHNAPTCQGSSGAVLWILGFERCGYMDSGITDHTHSKGGDGNDNNSGHGLEWEFPEIKDMIVHNHTDNRCT